MVKEQKREIVEFFILVVYILKFYYSIFSLVNPPQVTVLEKFESPSIPSIHLLFTTSYGAVLGNNKLLKGFKIVYIYLEI